MILSKGKDNSPISYWSYKITGGPIWAAVTGCIGDWFVPGFLVEFNKEYPGFDEKNCIAYAEEHCRTRKIGGDSRSWGQQDVEACVNAINGLSSSCIKLTPRGVDETEDLPQCDFLEAPLESNATDSTTQIDTGATMDSDTNSQQLDAGT